MSFGNTVMMIVPRADLVAFVFSGPPSFCFAAVTSHTCTVSCVICKNGDFFLSTLFPPAACSGRMTASALHEMIVGH